LKIVGNSKSKFKMKKTLIYLILSVLLGGAVIITESCQTKDPIPVAADGAVAVAEVNKNKSYFNFTNLATTDFEFNIRGEDFGRNVPVKSIELWIGFNNPRVALTAGMTACGVGVNCAYPNASYATLPSRLAPPGDRLFRTVETLPATVNITAAQAAQACGITLASIKSADTFQVKFVVNTQDGRRFDAFQDGICDETRGQVGDCRLIIRVDTKATIYQPLK
jgi:hypothetical protein